MPQPHETEAYSLRMAPASPKWSSLYPAKDYNVKFFLVLWFVNRYSMAKSSQLCEESPGERAAYAKTL